MILIVSNIQNRYMLGHKRVKRLKFKLLKFNLHDFYELIFININLIDDKLFLMESKL